MRNALVVALLGLASALTAGAESLSVGAAAEFDTDFSRHTVALEEIRSGGPPKDGIPAIDNPSHVEVEEANRWLEANEPIVRVRAGGEVRGYPLQVLIWHEIVNDNLGGVPLAVTFCPLCNTAAAFRREFDGRVLDFGTTGRLRFSNLIMYDRQTETWWQQADGRAIVGRYAGERLGSFPAEIVSWGDFVEAHPKASVLSRDTGFRRDYGTNPYVGYDDVDRPPFLYQGPPTPDALPPMARVLTLELGDEAVAYPYSLLREQRVVNDTVAGVPVLVLWAEGTASALDRGLISRGREVGSALAYRRQLDDRVLSFQMKGGKLVDTETGSTWDNLGRAESGPFKENELTPIVAINHFWFSWAAFRPDTRIFEAE